MITAIELEGFKGVGARTRLELGPLTLLFGANNAGKSTILQSLLYALEVLERGHADVDRTELGGQLVDLGGFARLVHRHEQGRILSVRIDFDCPGPLDVFERYSAATVPFEELDDSIDAAWIELRARAADPETGGRPFVSEMLVGIKGDAAPVVSLSLHKTPREGDPVRARINMNHALFADHNDGAVQMLRSILLGKDQGPDNSDVDLWVSRGIRPGAVPSFHEPMRVLNEAKDAEHGFALGVAGWLLEMLVIGTGRQLTRSLREAIYVGPLRAVPPRGFLSERSGRSTRWADGLAAWDALLVARGSLLENTNLWLNRLGAGCTLRSQQLFVPSATAEEITAADSGMTVQRLILEVGAGTFVLPCEVGAGISQVVPVVVAALEGPRRGLVMIEQPELHVHPRLQVGLGDLFIESSKEGRQLIVETHSEHLILRILRRIRETHDGEQMTPLTKPSFSPDQLSVLYIEQGPDGTTARRLRVDETGEFVDRWPKGFFEERADELF